MKKAIVISAGPLGLGTIRSLGIMGIKSIVIYSNKYEFAQYSKYVEEKIKIKDYSTDEIIKVLLKNKNHWKNLVVYPGNDESLVALSFHKKQLSKYYFVPVADYTIIEKLLNKKKTYNLAKKAGIIAPKNWYPENLNQLLNIKNKISYPCIIKPYERHIFFEIFKEKLFIVNSFKELSSKFKECLKHKIPVMISEIIQGPDKNHFKTYFYLDKKGNFSGGITAQKVRQHPPNFGVARVIKTMHKDKIMGLTKKFLKQIPGYVGPGSIEFKYDEQDKKYKIIEMNARNILQVSIATKAGVNFPYLIYKDYVLDKKIIIKKFKKNIYWIHASYDFQDLITNHVEKFTFKEIIMPYLNKKTYAIESVKDPMPMLYHWKMNLISLVKKVLP